MKKVLCKHIIFSKTPLKTHFQYNDQFQIFPCDFGNIPTSRFQTDFPIMLEYWYDDDEIIEVSDDLDDLENINKFISKNSKMMNKANRLTRLLTAITNHRFFTYSDKYDSIGRWGMSLPEGEVAPENKTPTSIWSIPYYHYDGIEKDLKIEQFSEPKHSNS